MGAVLDLEGGGAGSLGGKVRPGPLVGGTWRETDLMLEGEAGSSLEPCGRDGVGDPGRGRISLQF